MKVLIGTLSGGHALQAKYLIKKHVSDVDEACVITSKDDFQEYSVERTYKIQPIRKDPEAGISFPKAVVNFFRTLGIFLKERPDKVYCCGANNSLSLGFISLLSGIKTIALEANNRIREKSKSASILHSLGAEVWVSTEEMGQVYGSNFRVVGFMNPYADNIGQFRSDEKEIDYLVVPSSVDEVEGEDIAKGLRHEVLMERMGKTETVLTRGGMAAWEAAHLADKVIVVPVSESHESHQDLFASWLERNFDNVELREDFEKEIKKLRRKS